MLKCLFKALNNYLCLNQDKLKPNCPIDMERKASLSQ